MFDLISGQAQHIPQKAALPMFISTTTQVIVVSALLVPILFVTGQLPETPTMLAFVAAPPAPPPPPPPPPPAAPRRPTPATQPAPSASAAPVEMPASLVPESFDEEGVEGIPGGVEGGIPGGVIGGVVGGVLAEIAPPPPPRPVSKEPVRTGGNIQAPALIRRVEPIYPPMAVQAFITGTVILEATVDENGAVEHVRVLRSAGAILDTAALEAVRQWRYEPLLLNGIRTRFVLTAVLSFNLTQK